MTAWELLTQSQTRKALQAPSGLARLRSKLSECPGPLSLSDAMWHGIMCPWVPIVLMSPVYRVMSGHSDILTPEWWPRPHLNTGPTFLWPLVATEQLIWSLLCVSPAEWRVGMELWTPENLYKCPVLMAQQKTEIHFYTFWIFHITLNEIFP